MYSPIRSQCDLPVVFRKDRCMIMKQQVFHFGYNSKFPVVQYLCQVGASLAIGVFCWRWIHSVMAWKVRECVSQYPINITLCSVKSGFKYFHNINFHVIHQQNTLEMQGWWHIIPDLCGPNVRSPVSISGIHTQRSCRPGLTLPSSSPSPPDINTNTMGAAERQSR